MQSEVNQKENLAYKSFNFPMKFSRRFTHKTLRWPVFNQEKKFG